MIKKFIFMFFFAIFTLPLTENGFANPLSLEAKRKLFSQAITLLKADRFQEFDRKISLLTDYPLYSYLQYKRLSYQLDSDKEIEAYIRDYTGQRYVRTLQIKWLHTLAKRNKWSDFIQHYKESDNTKLQCYYYWALYNNGQKDRAFKGAEKIWLAGYSSRPKVCDPLFNVWRKDPSFTAKHVWQRFERAIKKNRPKLAGYLKKMLPDKYLHRADFWLDVHRRPEMVLECSNWNSHGARLEGEVFQHGIKRLSRQDPLLAISTWQERNDEFTINTTDKKQLDQSLALKLAYRKHGQAYFYLSQIKGGDERVRTWRVRTALQTGDWSAVLEALDKLSDTEKSEPTWRYWKARALTATGKEEDANKIYAELAKQRNYYGFLSADKLSTEYQVDQVPTKVDSEDVNKIAEEMPFKIVREFLHFDMQQNAKNEWWNTVQKLPPEKIRAAAKLAQRWGWNQTAIFTIAVAKEWNDLDLRFPLAFRDEIDTQAKVNQLDPAIIYGLVRRESAFDAKAHSPAGARGLMQIMPATGNQVARSLNEKWKTPTILYRPEVSIRYGSVYFKGLLDRFDNNSMMAAAGYNAGPHRVEQWLPKGMSIDADIWAETIPFTETRRYVKAVMEYSSIYRKKLGTKQVRISDLILKVPPASDKKRTSIESKQRVATKCG